MSRFLALSGLLRTVRLVNIGSSLVQKRHASFFSIIPFISDLQSYLFTPNIKTKKKKKRIRRKPSPPDPDSAEGIMLYELFGFIKEQNIINYQIPDSTIEYYLDFKNLKTIENLEILEVNSNGQGIAVLPSDHDPLNSKTIILVPFVTKGDIIQAKIGIHHKLFAEGHLLRVVKSSKLRNDRLIKCKHFTECSGCQLQMLPYDEQLKFKKNIVIKAFKKYGLNAPIQDTVASPLQYEYRTKLTPHFNSNRSNIMIGFEKSGIGRGMFNVRECEIARPVISNALKNDRHILEGIVRKYKKSGTILLRDKSIDGNIGYTTNHTEIISQKINDFVFQFPAGEFFQNNNSILPILINDISLDLKRLDLKNLVDTYCGSGFIGISLSNHIEKLIGIEISAGNLKMASENAKLNGLTSSQFILGSSEEIFKDLNEIKPEETCIVLDPSRKGSSHSYLSQLSSFKPKLIVYVSCNVFTQARDLAYFIKNTENGSKYELKTVQGFDFFPQTKHVESLAILELKKH